MLFFTETRVFIKYIKLDQDVWVLQEPICCCMTMSKLGLPVITMGSNLEIKFEDSYQKNFDADGSGHSLENEQPGVVFHWNQGVY